VVVEAVDGFGCCPDGHCVEAELALDAVGRVECGPPAGFGREAHVVLGAGTGAGEAASAHDSGCATGRPQHVTPRRVTI
jgi:hypothetical protein